MQKELGFTIIELITVIILIGILTVTVLPKFDGTASYEAHTHRAQLIAALRLTQQRAMQQTDGSDNYCHQLIFDNHSTKSRYGIPNRVDCGISIFPSNWEPDLTGIDLDNNQVSFDLDGKNNPSAVTFDNMGRPISNLSTALPNNCSGGCTINVKTSIETLQIEIEPEGFIHAI